MKFYKISFDYEWKNVCYSDAITWCSRRMKPSNYDISYHNDTSLIRFHFHKRNDYNKFKKQWKDHMSTFKHKSVIPYKETNGYYDRTKWLTENIGDVGFLWRSIVNTTGEIFYFRKQEDCTFFILTHT